MEQLCKYKAERETATQLSLHLSQQNCSVTSGSFLRLPTYVYLSKTRVTANRADIWGIIVALGTLKYLLHPKTHFILFYACA